LCDSLQKLSVAVGVTESHKSLKWWLKWWLKW
jgi:hypothetical protein